MIVKWFLKIIGYIHATLFFALMIPLVYALAELTDSAGAGVLYLKCLIIAIPVMVIERAANAVKSLTSYLLICAVLIVCISWITGAANASDANDICYCVGISAETFFIALIRLQHRLKSSAKNRENEPFAPKKAEFLDTPMLILIWYFVAVYMFGLCLNAKFLCDMAFYSAIVYFFLALLHTYFRNTHNYLTINKRTKGIPKKRLYYISFCMLLLFSALIFIGMLPAIYMTGQRQYTDIRHWFDDVKPIPYEYKRNIEFGGALPGDISMLELMLDDEPAPEPPAFMNTIFWIIGGACITTFAYGIFIMICQMFRDFKNGRDENGDIIESLEDKDKSGHDDITGRTYRIVDSAAEKIKRKYRKTIRKHRKDKPAPYESPMEIETLAGLKDDEQMQHLHKEYEKVRYGK